MLRSLLTAAAVLITIPFVYAALVAGLRTYPLPTLAVVGLVYAAIGWRAVTMARR